jgi:prevent-host-death family protein
MKKHPIAGARERARSLPRDMTDAEKSVWRILRLYQIDGHRLRRQSAFGALHCRFCLPQRAPQLSKLTAANTKGRRRRKQSEPASCKTRGTGFYAAGTTRCCRTWKACVRRSPKPCGVTPSQPSPIEGEGFDNILDQRLRWPDGHASYLPTMSTHTVAEANNQLSKLIDRALRGEGIVITRRGQPVVELKPLRPVPRPIAEADIEWLRARRVGRSMPRTDAGTLVSEMRDEGEK